MVKDFDEFVNLWKKESLGVKVKDEFKDYLFLMFFPQGKTWTLSVEKQAQTLALMLSGGRSSYGTTDYSYHRFL